MLIEWVYELMHNIDRHGLRWGVAITLLALVRKERRNYKLDKRDDALFHNQRIIMNSLGVGDQWVGHQTMSNEDRQNFKNLYLSSRKGIQWVYQSRRGKKMNQNINWVTLFLSVFGTLKLALQPFGIDLSHITDNQINDIVNGISALLAIYGVFATHRIKADSVQATAQPKPQLTDPDKFIQG